MAAEGAAGDVGAIGDGPDGDVGEATLQDQVERGGGQGVAGLPGLALPTVLDSVLSRDGVGKGVLVDLHVPDRTPQMSQWDMRPGETHVHSNMSRPPPSLGHRKVTSRCKVIDVD